MKLLPSVDFQHTAERPPVHTQALLQETSGQQREWPIYLRYRLPEYDLATTSLSVDLPLSQADLLIRQAGRVLRFAVRLEALSGPIPTWRIFYLGEPDILETRREWRNDSESFTGFVCPLGWDADQRVPTMSYDFSPSAIRLFLPWRLDPGHQLSTRWHLDNDWVEGTMCLVRRASLGVWWRQQQGYQAVARWDELSETMAYRWKLYCWRHQPALSEGVHQR